MLQSMGLQRVRHDLKTEQQQQHHLYVESKKIQLVNITKKKRKKQQQQTHRYRGQASGYHWGGEQVGGGTMEGTNYWV